MHGSCCEACGEIKLPPTSWARPHEMGKNWQRLTQETLVSKSVDALASVLMCKSMTNDQVNWHAKKATNEATAEPISNNEAKLIMTSIDAMLTLMSIPQMPCINPDRTDVKLHTCGKKIDWVPNRNHASLPQRLLFWKRKPLSLPWNCPTCFLKTIGYNETHHAHAGEELAAVRPRLHSNLCDSLDGRISFGCHSIATPAPLKV